VSQKNGDFRWPFLGVGDFSEWTKLINGALGSLRIFDEEVITTQWSFLSSINDREGWWLDGDGS